jgi:hypothetical protein
MSYGLFLIVVFTTLFITLVQGGDLLLTGFVVDALHSILISVEIANGSELHRDVHTPLGILTFLPIVLLMKMGLGAGAALGYANGLIGVVLLPATYWVGVSRFTGIARYLFGAMVMLFSMALLHGGTKTGVDMSMYYNRWGWAVSSLIIAITLLPNLENKWAPRFDGLILGGAAVFLIFSKITFAVCLGPIVLFGLLMNGRGLTLKWALVSFLGSLLLLLAYMGGIGFFINYIDDLFTVTNSTLRSYPSESLTYTAIGPEYFVGSLCLFGGLVFLRKDGFDTQGTLMLLLAPAVVYISYQNWGNDPFWTLPIALCLWQLSKTTEEIQDTPRVKSFGLAAVSVVMALSFVPVLQSLILSNLIHVAIENEAFDPVLSDTQHDNFKVLRTRLTKVGVERFQSPTGDVLETASVVFGGIKFEDCRLRKGEVGHDLMLARGVDAIPETAGKAVLLADLVQVLPLMSKAVFPKGMSPWYYGGTQGFDNVAFVAVPHCASLPAARLEMLETLNANGYVPELISNTSDLAVFKLSGGV